MNNKKTSDEWLVMNYFIEKYEGFPAGKLVKHESPDFLLKVNRHNTIGIELTQLGVHSTIGRETTDVLTEALQHTLEKKQQKIPLYNKLWLIEKWLIVYTDKLALPVGAKMEKLFGRLTVSSGFNRTYLFDLFTGKIFEINQ